MDDKLRREIILDNYNDPEYKGLVDDDSYLKVNQNSESCIDNLDFIVKIEDNVIKDIRFDGEACAISTSASNIMSRLLIGKSIDEVINILNNYKNMIEEKEYDEKILEDLIVYDNISKRPNRVNCALLPMKAINNILEGIKNGK